MQDFFISYNQADRSWAEWIAWELEEAGYSVLIQAWDFRPGSNFVLEMDKALKEAERMIAVLSPDYIKSSFTAPEWAAEFARDSTGNDRKLIPVRVREVDLLGLLRQIVYIDLVRVTEETATRALLLDGVQKGRAKPRQKPAYPGTPPRMKERPRFPGARPPIWNVPHNRNRNFIGRDDLLTVLRSQLLAGHHSALTALHGLGGIGKTQTAVEYTYRFSGEYDLVWWIRSDDPATLANDYALLASRLGLHQSEGNQQVAVQSVKDRLTAMPNWLLVFDNARKHEEIDLYLPAGGHVIITSRNPDWRTIADPLPVGTLRPEDAVDFLHKRSGQHDQRASTELVEELGWLPLAVEQAAAYIEVNNKPISDYLSLFRKHRQQLLKRGQPVSYPDTVETTWELSFNELEERSPAGAALLSLCAFLAPDDIPIDVITAASDRVPEPLASAAEDELHFDEAASALRRYSLVERRHEALSVHRLVQIVARDRMEESARKLWAASAARVILKAFPYDSDDVSTWETCARLLPHATIAAAHCEVEGAENEFAAGLLSQAALYLQGRADLAGARDLNERALRMFEAIHGPHHPLVGKSVNNLAASLRYLGDIEGARQYFQRALEISEAAYAPDDPAIATFVSNLGNILKDQGELEEARAHIERALKIDQAAYGPNHPNVAIRLNNLGLVINQLGDSERAREHFERALSIFVASYGPDHPQVGISISNLGRTLHDLGEWKEAQLLYERALNIDAASYGPDHPEVATDLNNLANLLLEMGHVDEAREHWQRALNIIENKLGADHPRAVAIRRFIQYVSDLPEAP